MELRTDDPDAHVLPEAARGLGPVGGRDARLDVLVVLVKQGDDLGRRAGRGADLDDVGLRVSAGRGATHQVAGRLAKEDGALRVRTPLFLTHPAARAALALVVVLILVLARCLAISSHVPCAAPSASCRWAEWRSHAQPVISCEE